MISLVRNGHKFFNWKFSTRKNFISQSSTISSERTPACFSCGVRPDITGITIRGPCLALAIILPTAEPGYKAVAIPLNLFARTAIAIYRSQSISIAYVFIYIRAYILKLIAFNYDLLHMFTYYTIINVHSRVIQVY